jgi:tRNA G18 (ribose-2'-O)-methylase SpoU
MTVFEIRQCTSKDCQLRIPIDPEVNRGAFCPKCGAPLICVVPAHKNYEAKHPLKKEMRQFTVILDNIRSAYNVGAIFRTADAVGVDKIYLCGITPEPENNLAISKTALGADSIVPWEAQPNAYLLVSRLKKDGFHLLALECTHRSIDIMDLLIDSSDTRPIALVVGNERSGIDPGIIDLCEKVLCLPMRGKKKSLNVAVAFGAAAYWLAFT